MIELIQFPWSPFCIVQRRILEYSGVSFKITDIPCMDRSRVWRLTRQRYYGVPIIRDGKTAVFETEEESQVIAKYLDEKFQLDLFPVRWKGIEAVLWRQIEAQIEDVCFRLNDIYWQEIVPPADQLEFLRFKERKFGRGCLDQWKANQPKLLEQLKQRLVPYDMMLIERPFLLDARPYFVDFDLYGMLGNFLYSGHYELPPVHARLIEWYERMSEVTKADFTK